MVKVAPLRYTSKVTKPADFDRFWQGVLEQAERTPLAPETAQDRLRTSDDFEVFQVHYDSVDDVRIFAWYCLPRNRPKRLPAVLLLPGYTMDPAVPKDWAQKGYAALCVAPRGKIRSNRQFNPGYPGLLTSGIIDRNTYGYRGFYVDSLRGVDYLLSREEVDPTRIGVTGGSQGGGLTITTTALRPEVRAAAASVPYLCGFVDAMELTSTYPYQEINDYLRLHPDRREAVLETVAYFDGINFADKITCPIIVNVGLQDNVCPPETGYALFEGITSGDKRFYPYEGHGHDGGRHRHNAIIDRFFQKHLKPPSRN